MKRSQKSGETAEKLARFDAEDRAVAYLAKFSPEVAFATALMAESMLAAKWSAEQAEMMQRGDNRKVFQIAEDDFQRMREARDLVPPGGKVHIEALHLITRLLSGLRPDEKWKVASAIHFRAAVRALLPDGFLPEPGASAP
jgi:hypothetical protein